MNLYEIMMEHYAPKDSEKGIYTYLAAKSDEHVYEWLKSVNEVKDGRAIYNSYQYNETNEKYNGDGEESFKERMIRLKGDFNDDEAEFPDLNYGVTLIGWKAVKENITDEEIRIIQGTGISLEVA